MGGDDRKKDGAEAGRTAPRGRVIEEGPGARAAAAAASQAAKAERLAKTPDDPLEAALSDLASEDRSKKLVAIFALGQAFAGAGAPDADLEPVEARRLAIVVERLEAALADRTKGGAWARKRAKRALKKIREAVAPGEDEDDPDADADDAEGGVDASPGDGDRG